jgi:RecJ-like exonuclease
VRNFVLTSVAAAAIGSGYFSVEDTTDVSAEIAVEAAMDQFREAKPPANAVCENCRGTGKIGDGRVVYDCPICGGDGKSKCEGEKCHLR